MKRFQTEGRPVLVDDPKLLTDLALYEIEMARAAAQRWSMQNGIAPSCGSGARRRRPYPGPNLQGNRGRSRPRRTRGAQLGRDDGCNGRKAARVLNYEPVIEWICGMGFAVYDL
jgi:2,3-dihydroxyphenylpropionate 1,2-dioxygenase